MVGPAGAFWRDKDETFHVLVDLGKKRGTFLHFTSGDFETWNREGKVELSTDLFGTTYKRVDDLTILPFRNRLKVGLLNRFVKGNHQPLEMVAGPSWDRMQYVGNCIYPKEQIDEDKHPWSFHESTITWSPSRENDFLVYFTHRYEDTGNPRENPAYDIDMAYLMFGEKRTYPVVKEASVAAGATTGLADCTEIPLSGVDTLNLMVELTYGASATADPGATVHLRSSSDGVDYDTQDYTSFDVPLDAGATARRTVNITPDPEYLKVLVENLTGYDVTDLKVVATLG